MRSSIGCDYVGWEYDQMGIVATLMIEVQGEVNRTAWQVRQFMMMIVVRVILFRGSCQPVQ